ncbi:MAG: hypothetical protein CL681_25470 [Blastopirellula sp.]|nr:hypothetical protein [Blastopirellula sp.]
MSKSRWFGCAILVAAVIWLLVTISSDHVVAFRDGAHYYYPLFHWCRSEWQAGRIPLWNPYENCGTPALADATSSVLYPGKILFALPVAYPAAYNLYVFGHIVLAGIAAYLAARHWNASRCAAFVAAVSYALSGSVLFQYCNVVFLVGAAWLPLALQTGDMMLRRSSWPAVLGFGVVLALMNLGGDPQMAYQAVLLTGGWYLVRSVRSWWRMRARKPERRLPLRFVKLGGMFFGSLVLAFGLSACQVLPAAKWARTSQRAAYENPRTIYEWMETSPSGSGVASLFQKAPVGSHQHAVYQFSVGPWRLSEFLWPNISGRLFPTDQRWTRVIPAEGRIWSPSLYMGTIPFLLAILSIRFWRGSLRVRYLSWVILLATLASFGGYGVGWLVEEVRAAAGATEGWAYKPVGGLYWFMVVFLPGYVYFRFPAKLMVVATLGLSLLAARGFDRIRLSTALLRRVCGWLGVLSCLGAAVTWCTRSPLSMKFAEVPAGAVFGPLDVSGAIDGMILAFLHVALVCGGMVALLSWQHRTRAWIMAAVILVEICLANRVLLTTAPATAFMPLGQGSETPEGTRLDRGWVPVVSPPEFSSTRSDQRNAELIAWQREARFARFNLLDPTPVVRTSVTLSSLTHDTFVTELRRADTTGALLRNLLCVSRDRQLGVREIRPRVWIPQSATVLEPLASHHPRDVSGRSREVARLLAEAPNPRHVAVIEGSALGQTGTQFSQTGGEQSSCQMLIDTPQCVEVAVNTDSACLLVLADTYDDGWQVTLAGDDATDPVPVEMLRVNRIMRGVMVPPGDTRVVFRYRPRTFWMGALVSACSWLAAAVWGCLWCVRRRTRQI